MRPSCGIPIALGVVILDLSSHVRTWACVVVVVASRNSLVSVVLVCVSIVYRSWGFRGGSPPCRTIHECAPMVTSQHIRTTCTCTCTCTCSTYSTDAILRFHGRISFTPSAESHSHTNSSTGYPASAPPLGHRGEEGHSCHGSATGPESISR